MNKLVLKPIITVEDKNVFISEVQEAFQVGFEKEFGHSDEKILPQKDIEES